MNKTLTVGESIEADPNYLYQRHMGIVPEVSYGKNQVSCGVGEIASIVVDQFAVVDCTVASVGMQPAFDVEDCSLAGHSSLCRSFSRI